MRTTALASLAALAALAACNGSTPAVSRSAGDSSLFSDSSVYRARCAEADSIRVLVPIPRQCTPRDQRAEPRVFEPPRPQPPTPPPQTPPQR